jgi:hypothetical protein
MLVVLGFLVFLSVGCTPSKIGLKKKFMVEKWPLSVKHKAYEAFRDVPVEHGMHTTKLDAPKTGQFDGLLNIFSEEMQKAFPEIKVEKIDKPMTKWAENMKKHVVVEIWPVSEFKPFGGSSTKFRLHLIIKVQFYEVFEGKVHPMGFGTPEFAREYGEVFSAGKSSPTYAELVAAFPEKKLFSAVEKEFRAEIAEFIKEIKEAKE